jgi:hypothetical protein
LSVDIRAPLEAAAVKVDDLGLAALPAIPCVVPHLKRLTLRQAKRALQRSDLARCAFVVPLEAGVRAS